MFNLFGNPKTELKKSNLEQDIESTVDNSLYQELTLQKEILAKYLPIGYFIVLDGHRLVVFDDNGKEVSKRQDARLLRQDNKMIDNVVISGKEVHVVSTAEDGISRLLKDSFVEDSMAQLPESVQKMFTDRTALPEELSLQANYYLKEQDWFKEKIERGFQVKDYNDFLLKDLDEFQSLHLTIDGDTLNQMIDTKMSTKKYTLLLMVESLDTGKYQIIPKPFTFTELIVFNEIHLKDTNNVRLRLQLYKHEKGTLEPTTETSELYFIFDKPTFIVEDGVLKNK